MINSPNDIAALKQILVETGAWITRKGKWIHGYKNCFNISTFLIERITNSGSLLKTQELILDEVYENWSKNSSTIYKTFIRILRKEIKKNEFPLYYLLAFKNPQMMIIIF